MLLSNCSYAFLFTDESNFNGWAHIELGGGNYGLDGHTKASQSMTVLLKIIDISGKRNYIDNLEECGTGDYKPHEQYHVLFWTLDQMVQRYGDAGIFHVNDLYEEYANYAALKLKEYAISKGYDSVIIESVAGDYEAIDTESILGKFGKKKYTSAHLKNPENSFYHNQIDGDKFISSESYREYARSVLQKLANLSEGGLDFFIIYYDDYIPIEEKVEFMEKEVFYKQSTEWNPVPYIFPEGDVVEKSLGKVLSIKPSVQ